MISFSAAKKIALSLPGVEESVSYGTPSFKVNGKFMGRLLEDGMSLSLSMDREERQAWCAAAPQTFSVPEHFKKYDYIVIHLQSVEPADMQTLLMNAWRRRAPRKLVQNSDQGSD